MLRASVLAVTLIACGHRGTVPEPTQTATAALPAGPPLVTPGERMSYRLSLKGFDAATYNISVGDIQRVAGKQTILVQSHAKSRGFASLVATIDERFTSWIDIGTGRSVRFQTDDLAKNKRDVEHVVIDLAARDGDRIPIQFSVNDQAPRPEPQKASMPEVWDYNAFLVALRSWEAAPGTTTTLEVFRSRWLWRIDVKIRGREKLVTELGDFPALRFDCHARKLDRVGAKYPDNPERDFSVWISDDDGRVPLRLTARTDYGDIEFQIVAYDPGTQPRIRR